MAEKPVRQSGKRPAQKQGGKRPPQKRSLSGSPSNSPSNKKAPPRRSPKSKAAAKVAKEAREVKASAASIGLGGGLTPKLRRKLFFQSSLPDFVLVLLVSVALVFTVSYGFESAADIRGNVLFETVICTPLLVALFAGSWSKKALIPSAIAVVVLAVVIVGCSMAAMPADVPLFADRQINDVPNAYMIFGFILVIIPIVVYLLSRRTVALVFLLATSILACGTIQFLYRDWLSDQPGLLAALVVFFGIAMMFIYQNYKQSIYQAKRVKSTRFFGVFGFAALTGGLCVLVGVVLFFGVVNAIGISTPEIKLWERYIAQPEIEVTPTVHDQLQQTLDEKTNKTNEDNDTTKNEAEGADDSITDDGSNTQSDNPVTQAAELLQSFDATSWAQSFSEIGYFIPDPVKWLIAVVLVALAVLFTLFWRYRRKLRLKRLEKQSYPYRVWYLYGFLMERYRRMKIRKPDYLTPFEFALGARHSMQSFAENTGGTDFVQVTDVYQRVCYGGEAVGAAEYASLVGYYKAFFKNARRHTGGLKWLWKFWRI
jgi:hypothetical protein